MMVRQGGDRHAGLALIPSRLDCLPYKRLEIGFEGFLTLEKAVVRLTGRSWSANSHRRRIGRGAYVGKEPFEAGLPGSLYG